MKTTIRKVEIEKEFYIAKDGKEFGDEGECIDYENELNIKSIEAYDEDFNRTDFEGAIYVVIHSDEELNFICEICEYNGWTYDGLNENGLYRYNSYYRVDKWEKVKIPLFLKDFVEFI
jgi:hypothetical protein